MVIIYIISQPGTQNGDGSFTYATSLIMPIIFFLWLLRRNEPHLSTIVESLLLSRCSSSIVDIYPWFYDVIAPRDSASIIHTSDERHSKTERTVEGARHWNCFLGAPSFAFTISQNNVMEGKTLRHVLTVHVPEKAASRSFTKFHNLALRRDVTNFIS